MDWQTAAVLVLVGLAVLYLARYVRQSTAAGPDACGGCGGCEVPAAKGTAAPKANHRS